MIIVEGGDNVGKTTLVSQLLEADPESFVIARRRFSPNQGGSIGQSYLDMLVPTADAPHRLGRGIADRFLASEHVYGDLYRGGSRITIREEFLIRATLLSWNPVIVHCDPPDTAVMTSWREREQLYDRNPLEIVHAYRQRVASIFAPLPIVRYDWTHADAPEIREYILRVHRFRALIRHVAQTPVVPFIPPAPTL